MPRLGLGTWTVGGGMTHDPNNDDKGQSEQIQKAIEAGFSWIRTAHNYAENYCEKLVGQAIKKYDRSKLFLSSAANERFAPNKQALIDVAKLTLDNLQTDYLDLFMIGAIGPTPVQEIVDGLLELQESGLVKNIGVSNYRKPELEYAFNYSGKKIVYDEMHYNLVIREPELCGSFDFCRKNGIVLSAYRPLQLGQLSKPGIVVLDEMAKKYGKTQSQISLGWLIQKEGVIVVVKVLDDKHVTQDLDIFDWSIEEKDMQRLDKEFPIQIRTSDCSGPRKAIFERQ